MSEQNLSTVASLPPTTEALLHDLGVASRKDAGVDPGVLAWLLAQFPTHPLPEMLEPLTSEQLEEFRNALAEKFRRGVIP